MNFTKRMAAIFVVTLLVCSVLYPQIPAPEQRNPVAITGATIYTISGEVIENGTLIFEDGKITALGQDVEIPDGAEEYDATGKFIYPAFIHSYTNLGLTEIGAVDVTSDFNEFGQINPNVRAEKAFHPESEHIPVARSHGVGVTLSSPSGSTISGLSAAMLMDGWTWEEMTLRAPIGLVINWPFVTDDNNNTQNQLEAIKEAFDKARAYKNARAASPAQRIDMKWEAMIPVLRREIPVVVQANNESEIRGAITWAESEDVRIIILGGRDAQYTAHQLVAREIPVVITQVLTSPGRPWQGYDDIYANAAKLHALGIQFAIAGEYGSANAMRLRHHAATAAGFGLHAEEALKAITLYPAKIFGLSDRIGSLEVGKDATLILTDGDVLDLRSNIEQMFIQGRKIDMADKQKNLFERYREKYRQLSED